MKKTIVGHERAERFLAHAIRSEKIFPAWIFCGPFGVGKSSLAHMFAKCLLAGRVPENDSVNIIEAEDQINRLVDMRTHPDFFVIEQSDNPVSIDDTRNLLQKIHKMPTLSRWRVVIIENASNLNKNIYNSLLKILEEPPKNTAIIMVCQNTGLIPKTLLSRSVKIDFNPLELNTVQRVLDDIGFENSQKFAKLSNGSIGYAIYLKNHNGIEIYDLLLRAFEYFNDGVNQRKNLQRIIDKYIGENFLIVKESLLKILKLYVETLTGTIDQDKYSDEVAVFGGFIGSQKINIDDEIRKTLEIISIINKTEALMLDKSAVLVYVYEKFFNFAVCN
jgi:hypothetical protein